MSVRNKNIIKSVILIAFIYALILWIIPFYKAAVSEKLVTDGLIFSNVDLESKNGVKGLPIYTVRKGSSADKAGIMSGDLLLKINGLEITSFDTYRSILTGSDPETPSVYTILRNNNIISFNVYANRYFHLLFFIFAFLGLGFLFNGFMVGYSKPDDSTSIIFFILGFTASLGLLIYGGVTFYIGTNFFLNINYQICLTAFFPAFFHFFLTYPHRYNFKRRKLVISLVYIITFLIEILLMYSGIINENSYPVIIYILSYLPFILIIGGVYLYIKSYRKLRPNKSLKYILYGLIIGFAGFVYYFTVFSYFISTSSDSILLRMPSMLVLAIPVSFGYSIYKYKILDTENFIKKGLVFFVISFLIVMSYLIIYYTIDTFVSINLGNYKQLVLIIMLVALILIFDVVNKRVKNFVDKRFFRSRYNYRKTLMKISQALPKTQNIDDVISTAIDEIKGSMQVTEIFFWLNPHSNLNVKIENSIGTDSNIDTEFIRIFNKTGEAVLLDDTYLYSSGFSKVFIEKIKSLNIVLSIPVFVKNNLIAALNLSPKISFAASNYSEKDIDLLNTVSNQIAVAIDNARLHLLENEKLRLEEEIQIAGNIQKGLFPKNFDIDKRLDISGINIPYQSVGGDFFDLIKIDENRILVSIADVSLKGIPAAMYMAKLQALIHLAVKHFQKPSEILKVINNWTYKKIERNSFILMSIAVIDLENKIVSIARGGNCPAVRFTNGSAITLNSKGMALGIAANDVFSSNIDDIEIKFTGNDLFLFYTNGLTKISNNVNKELTLDEIISFIINQKNLKSKNIVNNLVSEINFFRGNAVQNDDLLFLIAKMPEHV